MTAIQAMRWRIAGLLGFAAIGIGCGSSDSLGAMVDAGCLAPRQIIYTTPGCGAEAIPRCEVPNGDGCSMAVCLCDGVTTSGDGCGFSHEPFLYGGHCKQDAAATVDAPISVDVTNDGAVLPACNWPKLDQGDASPGQCRAERALLECVLANGSSETCTSSNLAGCPDQSPATTVSCTAGCASSEYAMVCGSPGPSAVTFQPPAALNCHAQLYTPAGVVFYCCPCP